MSTYNGKGNFPFISFLLMLSIVHHYVVSLVGELCCDMYLGLMVSFLLAHVCNILIDIVAFTLL